MTRRFSLPLLAATCLVALLCTPSTAEAFCGFYVSGADAQLYNDATMVVMMRDGQRTVLSMQNDYQGPPEDFAMVVPVPVVLQQENVKTLPDAVFDKVDKMAAPRLVEYWEQDPCKGASFGFGGLGLRGTGRGGGGMAFGKGAGVMQPKVKIEAEFDVEEYEIVILSAEDSNSLDAWLRQNKYNIPDGAEPMLRPYIEGGMYFFVARVNAKKVKFDPKTQRARLSPLRFHYDEEEFKLPVRLGLLNARGEQDLLVHILASGQRYEVANQPNVTIPTNLDVSEEVKGNFGSFYAALFDRVREKNEGAVVTEYSWDASTCDPCPGPRLTASDFQTLGADVTPSKATSGLVLTRLHARYSKDDLKDDLVFKEAPPILGGREVYDGKGQLERGVTVFDGANAGQGTGIGVRGGGNRKNNFQGRYAIRHVWDKGVNCDKFTRGRWGGPPGGGSHKTSAAQDTAYARRDAVELEGVLRSDLPELSVKAKTTTRQLLIGSTGAVPAGGGDADVDEAPAPPQQVDADASDEPSKPARDPDAGASMSADKSTPAPEKDRGGCAVPVGDVGAGSLWLLGLIVALGVRRR